jgi:SAM-dependent methyltransferase
MPAYDEKFFDYVNSGAIWSAERILPRLLSELAPGSVLDVGCGQGAWLSVWKKLGVMEITGIDGDYVSRERLLIPDNAFVACDLANGFWLDRRYDLVQSLEVAEHLPADRATRFVDSLVRHGDLIFFSAAPKGQGGDHHVNEQNYDYWRKLFAQHGYIAIDYLRPLVLQDRSIEPWYRYNTLLYASSERFDTLPEAVKRSRVPDNQTIPDLSPGLYKLRKQLVRLLPVSVATWLAKIKERQVATIRQH